MTRSFRRLIAVALLTVAGAGVLSAAPSHRVATFAGGPLAAQSGPATVAQ